MAATKSRVSNQTSPTVTARASLRRARWATTRCHQSTRDMKEGPESSRSGKRLRRAARLVQGKRIEEAIAELEAIPPDLPAALKARGDGGFRGVSGCVGGR
jgi:hypothetical protein